MAAQPRSPPPQYACDCARIESEGGERGFGAFARPGLREGSKDALHKVRGQDSGSTEVPPPEARRVFLSLGRAGMGTYRRKGRSRCSHCLPTAVFPRETRPGVHGALDPAKVSGWGELPSIHEMASPLGCSRVRSAEVMVCIPQRRGSDAHQSRKIRQRGWTPASEGGLRVCQQGLRARV